MKSWELKGSIKNRVDCWVNIWCINRLRGTLLSQSLQLHYGCSLFFRLPWIYIHRNAECRRSFVLMTGNDCCLPSRTILPNGAYMFFMLPRCVYFLPRRIMHWPLEQQVLRGHGRVSTMEFDTKVGSENKINSKHNMRPESSRARDLAGFGKNTFETVSMTWIFFPLQGETRPCEQGNLDTWMGLDPWDQV